MSTGLKHGQIERRLSEARLPFKFQFLVKQHNIRPLVFSAKKFNSSYTLTQRDLFTIWIFILDDEHYLDSGRENLKPQRACTHKYNSELLQTSTYAESHFRFPLTGPTSSPSSSVLGILSLNRHRILHNSRTCLGNWAFADKLVARVISLQLLTKFHGARCTLPKGNRTRGYYYYVSVLVTDHALAIGVPEL